MMETITLTEAFAVVYAPDDFGSKTIVNMLPIFNIVISSVSSIFPN